jgi:hypothetical protein
MLTVIYNKFIASRWGIITFSLQCLLVCCLMLCGGCNDRHNRKIGKLLGTSVKVPNINCVKEKKDLVMPGEIKLRDRSIKLLNEEKEEDCLKLDDY